RLRAVLQALRLIRVQNNQLVIVRSRYERFKQFPTTQQFYLLWHADAYHTAWGDFSGMWTAYMQLVQDNLPLLWEAQTEESLNLTHHRDVWSQQGTQLFMEVW